MVRIEEIEPAWQGVDCELEENVPRAAQPCPTEHGGPDAEGGPLLQENVMTDGSEDESDEWEIPFAEREATVESSVVVEVRLSRRGDEPLGLVLDEDSCVVMLRENTPASLCGEIMLGDQITAVQGVAVTRARRVATLLHELPESAVCVLQIKRELQPPEVREHLEHGPLMTRDERDEFEERQEDIKHQLRQAIEKGSWERGARVGE